jgi:hypothetical protein
VAAELVPALREGLAETHQPDAAGEPAAARPPADARPPVAAGGSAAAQQQSRGSAGARAWLAGTLIVTLGAAGAAIALAPPGGAPAPEGLAFLLFTGSSVHVASTGWFYAVPEVRGHMRHHPARYVWWPIALIAGACVIAASVPREGLYWLLLPYFGWQFFHYQKQNLGLAALSAAAHRLTPLSRAERRALTCAGLAGIAGLAGRPALLQLPLRLPVPDAFGGAAIAFAACVTVGVGCLLARPRADRPAGFCAVYLTSLVFSLPVFLFTSPYAAVAGLTIAHGLQYLLLMGLLAAGGQSRGRGRTAHAAQLAALCNIALLGGAALSVASDQLTAGPAMRWLYGLFLGAVMAHFVVDAGLWRMRDEFPRAFLRSRLPYLLPGGGPLPGSGR